MLFTWELYTRQWTRYGILFNLWSYCGSGGHPGVTLLIHNSSKKFFRKNSPVIMLRRMLYDLFSNFFCLENARFTPKNATKITVLAKNEGFWQQRKILHMEFSGKVKIKKKLESCHSAMSLLLHQLLANISLPWNKPTIFFKVHSKKLTTKPFSPSGNL